MDTVTLRFASNPRLLRVVRSATAAVAEATGFDARDVDSICMAVDEACANIMRHCYGGRCDQPIEMEWRCGPDRLVVVLRDSGPPFEPGQVPERDLTELRPGGLGLHLMREVMDEVTYVPGADRGTELVLIKYCTPRHEESNGR